jgi:hypothetical protein
LHRTAANKSVSDKTYARARAKFGEEGVVEAATIEGLYTFLSIVTNMARGEHSAGIALVPLPR